MTLGPRKAKIAARREARRLVAESLRADRIRLQAAAAEMLQETVISAHSLPMVNEATRTSANFTTATTGAELERRINLATARLWDRLMFDAITKGRT
jgi:hypothetical protein